MTRKHGFLLTRWSLVVSVLCLTAGIAPAADPASEFEAHTLTTRTGKLPYRLLRPPQDAGRGKFPLVVGLHGWGQRGTYNQKQLKYIGPTFLKSKSRERFPCFVLLPQSPGGWIHNPNLDRAIPLTRSPTATLAMTIELIRSITKQEPVDKDRIYLMGISNGACGVWELLERDARPWAAAVILAGAGDPKKISRAAGVPIWAFHAANDKTIPIGRMEEMVSALKAAHGKPRRTVIGKGDHNAAWIQPLKDPKLLEWLFAQRRGGPARRSKASP